MLSGLLNGDAEDFLDGWALGGENCEFELSWRPGEVKHIAVAADPPPLQSNDGAPALDGGDVQWDGAAGAWWPRTPNTPHWPVLDGALPPPPPESAREETEARRNRDLFLVGKPEARLRMERLRKKPTMTPATSPPTIGPSRSIGLVSSPSRHRDRQRS